MNIMAALLTGVLVGSIIAAFMAQSFKYRLLYVLSGVAGAAYKVLSVELRGGDYHFGQVVRLCITCVICAGIVFLLTRAERN